MSEKASVKVTCCSRGRIVVVKFLFLEKAKVSIVQRLVRNIIPFVFWFQKGTHICSETDFVSLTDL